MRVLLADDHSLFLEALRRMLSDRGVEVVGIAHDGLEALVKARRLRPDVILMDITMPRCDGLEATRRIKAELPDVKVVILSASLEDEDLFDAIKSGASGYLVKNLDTEEFFNSLQELTEGEPPLARGLSAKILGRFARLVRDNETAAQQTTSKAVALTSRQTDVLTLVAQGLTYKEIAARLHFSQRTVKYDMRRIMERLGLASRAEAILYAERAGLVGQTPTNDGPLPAC